MAWTWRYTNEAGKQADDLPTESFSSQADAESWMGQTWRELADGGAATATLVEGDRVEYEMSLATP